MARERELISYESDIITGWIIGTVTVPHPSDMVITGPTLPQSDYIECSLESVRVLPEKPTVRIWCHVTCFEPGSPGVW